MNNTFLKDGDIKRFQLEDLTGKTVRIESSVFNGHSITTAKDIANGDMYILAESNEEENEMIDPGKKDWGLWDIVVAIIILGWVRIKWWNVLGIVLVLLSAAVSIGLIKVVVSLS